MRVNINSSEDPQVAMSPLIDCVFLLLIFFLVTTMLKKWEKQIPVTLPDATSTLSAEAQGKPFIIGLDVTGAAYDGNQREPGGHIQYTPVEDLSVFLEELAAARDPSLPLEIMADRETPMQKVIAAFDQCQLAGFKNTSVHLRNQ